jgi:hypothetical protein
MQYIIMTHARNGELESFGRLGKPLMKLITDVSDQATQHGNGTFTHEQLVTGVLRELSVCLYRRNASLEGRWLGALCGLVGALTPRGLISQRRR